MEAGCKIYGGLAISDGHAVNPRHIGDREFHQPYRPRSQRRNGRRISHVQVAYVAPVLRARPAPIKLSRRELQLDGSGNRSDCSAERAGAEVASRITGRSASAARKWAAKRMASATI